MTDCEEPRAVQTLWRHCEQRQDLGMLAQAIHSILGKLKQGSYEPMASMD